MTEAKPIRAILLRFLLYGIKIFLFLSFRSSSPFSSVCTHCQIAFASPSMFAAHSALHSRGDPMRCAACGEEAADAEAFYEHIVRY